ncbi:hypothetical protein [Burkholderia cenocepacia]|uniref:hypothetical protein n=1 Tax=Burkholderia cenocepacia TaxID=95486 RepID=UPI0022387B21|nr:hypothetical protein [Burkholderia cenocepacia]MCW5156326.1 hypothetical protein [Burkholderia cenocepacia]
MEAKSVLLKTIDEYKELIYHATILFCQSNDVVIHTDDYMEQRNWENSEDLECLFHGMPFVHFDALLADDIFDDIRDRDLNYDDRQDEISAEYIEKKFNELKPREIYHFLNRSLQTKEVKSTRTKI